MGVIYYLFCMSLGGVTVPAQAQDSLTIDDFKTRSIQGPVLQPSGTHGFADVNEDLLKLSLAPGTRYATVDATRNLKANLSKTFWFHFRFRYKETLLGANMYTAFFFGPGGASDSTPSLKIGINGGQHWKSVYGDGNGKACTPKETDDELFVSISPDFFPGFTDVRLAYPNGHSKSYSEWGVFSIKLEPQGTRTRISFYLDGHELSRRSLDDANGLSVPEFSEFKFPRNSDGLTDVTARFTILGDGDENAFLGGNFGNRGRGCYAAQTPALPSAIPVASPYPAMKDWMLQFNRVAVAVSETWESLGLGERYAAPQVSPDWLHVTTLSPQARFYDRFQLLFDSGHDDGSIDKTKLNEFRTKLNQRLWDAAFAGELDFKVAVLMGALPLPPADHPGWKHEPAGARESLQAELSEIDGQGGRNPKGYVWHEIYKEGGAMEAVRYGYVFPEELRDSSAWASLSSAERELVPLPAYPRPVEMQWDYLLAGTEDDFNSASSRILELVNQGRLPTSAAITGGLLSPQKASSNCQFLSCEEVNLGRTKDPSFCPGQCQ